MSSSTWNIELINKRNNDIVKKHTYLYDVKRKRFDDVIYELQWTYFFLTERTIKEILRRQSVVLPYRNSCNHTNTGLTLKEARNNKVLSRFDYLTEVKRMRFDDAIDLMSKAEFYVEPNTIEQIITRWTHHHPIEDLTLFD